MDNRPEILLRVEVEKWPNRGRLRAGMVNLSNQHVYPVAAWPTFATGEEILADLVLKVLDDHGPRLRPLQETLAQVSRLGWTGTMIDSSHFNMEYHDEAVHSWRVAGFRTYKYYVMFQDTEEVALWPLHNAELFARAASSLSQQF